LSRHIVDSREDRPRAVSPRAPCVI
jgi:hypothetical protein